MASTILQPTILVVEDEPHILEIITFLLEDEGYCVLQAINGERALSLLKEAKPDIVVSDVKMPTMDGYTLCQRVRATPEFSQIPFIFLTAKGEKADIRRGMELGADDYLTKPFEPEELLLAIEVRLARAAETRKAISKAGSDLQDKIIRTLTHEFRTPLALVAGYTDLLESTGQEMSEKDFETILQGLHTGSSRLMNLVEDFLLVSRLKTGAVAREIAQSCHEPLALDPVVNDTVAQAESQAAAKNVSLIVHCGTLGTTMPINKQHLVEIVRRMVDNAIKFSKNEGGCVVVTTYREGNTWVLSVADDGIGIRQEALAWIFEAFRQVDRTRMEQQGSGVGLTIVQGLAQVYGGQVTVESIPGQGSTFFVRLPITVQGCGSQPASISGSG